MGISMANVLKNRLEMAVKKDGRSPRAISLAATGKPDTIRDILRGKVKSPQHQTLQRLARALGIPFAELTGGQDGKYAQVDLMPDSAVPARVVGLVQAGAFMDPDEYSAFEHDPQYIASVRDNSFPEAELIAFEIVGDSIDRVCPPGGYAICVPFDMTGLVPKHGLWVVAERQRGGLIERTIKQVRQNGRSLELHPASANPKHKPIRFPSAEDHEEVRILALVRRFIGPSLPY